MKILITITSDPIGGSKVIVEADDEQPINISAPAVAPPAREPALTVPPLRGIPSAEIEPKPTKTERAQKHTGSGKKPLPPKKCIVCDDYFVPRRGVQVLCGKTHCKKEYARRYAKNHSKVAKPTVDKVDWCKYCEAYTTHNTAGHNDAKGVIVPPAPKSAKIEPEFLPGHEKSPEELEEIKHQFKPILPGDPEYGSAPRTSSDETAANNKRAKESRDA